MRFAPLAQAFSDVDLTSVRLVATDMDGTLTTEGKFTPALLQAFEQLTAAGIQVLLVTGRSAGWGSGLAHYLPIWGAIAENGGLFYAGEPRVETLLVPLVDTAQHRQRLAEMFQHLQTTFPNLRESDDNRFRVTDWTFDVQGLAIAELEQLERLCQSASWGFTYSTVQCHLKLRSQDKAAGLLDVLQQHFPDYTAAHIVTVGDSPNDESLFDAKRFPFSVGVANVLDYRDRLAHQPAYVTNAAAGEGFRELAQLLCRAGKREKLT
ncbi:HAD-IIB family hydrolase [Stenomitos frigidus]|uniref:HAD family hydrolase n=1 Tax=Stenomitos frigidus ULC18 TaxID=2107698 RepID=A0A2T1ELN4_9CYAN|nr:HAD family hydrolase [Stenomitos frigidus]PSB33621.1 HAD family hydrolase [Stenomitos frigidus ULC18]